MKKRRRKAKFDLSKIDVEHFLEVMKVENLIEATEEEWQFSCPFPGHAHGDQSPSAYMNKETTAWMCHGCKRSGNAITFYSDLENVTTQEARSVLQRQYGGASPDPDSYSIMAELQRFWDKQRAQQQEEIPNAILDDDLLDDYALDWAAAARAQEEGQEIPEEMDYMFQRGFTAETLDDWDIGIDYRVERITIPTYNAMGQLVGFKGRSWRKEHKPKYLVMGGKRYAYPRFEKSQMVFGLNRVVKKYGDQANLILCEGELDVISMHDKGFDTAVCVAGSDISQKQALLIRRWGRSTTIFFDTDEGGAFGTRKVIEILNPFTSLRVVPDHEGDPAELQINEIQQLLDESESGAKAVLMSRQGE
jgi:DNA primase